MKPLQILIVLLVFIAAPALGQENLSGKWYMFSRNRMVELNFLQDRRISKQLNWDLSDRPRSQPDTLLIKGSRRANRNLYLYTSHSKRNGNKLSLTTIRIIRPGEEIFIALNGADTLFEDTLAIARYIQSDTAAKFGMPLFSEKEIQRLRAQKSVNEMTEADFEIYGKSFLRSKAQLDSLSKLSTSENGLLYYAYAMMRIIFAQIGYNPFVTTDEMERLIARFKNNPRTKAIVSEMLEEN